MTSPTRLSVLFFSHFIQKSRGSKNNITEEAGRGRYESDVKVRKKDVNQRKKEETRRDSNNVEVRARNVMRERDIPREKEARQSD